MKSNNFDGLVTVKILLFVVTSVLLILAFEYQCGSSQQILVLKEKYYVAKESNHTIQNKLNKIMTKKPKRIIKSLKSLCSIKADKRGPGQRVISFCIFGKNPKESQDFNGRKTKVTGYFNGVEKNLKKIRQLYPDYTMRLYFNTQEFPPDSPTHQMFVNLERLNDKYFDLCDVMDLESIDVWINLK